MRKFVNEVKMVTKKYLPGYLGEPSLRVNHTQSQGLSSFLRKSRLNLFYYVLK